MAKFIGETGLVYLWAKIKAWVSAYAKITESSGTKSLTVGNTTATIATKTSELTNDSDFITSADIPEGAAASSTTPLMDGTASVGSETRFARGDHRHPSDTSKQNVISDLETIRSGASAGATAYQKPSGGIPATDMTAAVQSAITAAGNAISSSEKGAANGVAPLDSNSKIDAQYLPSYVDDVVEAYIRSGQTALSSTWLATGSATGTVITPEAGKIYVLMNSDSTYTVNSEFRWGGTTYVRLNDSGCTEMTNAEMDTATNNWT